MKNQQLIIQKRKILKIKNQKQFSQKNQLHKKQRQTKNNSLKIRKTSTKLKTLMTFEDVKYGLFVSIVEDQNQRFINLFERENVNIDCYLNKYNWTALQTAAYTGNGEIINYLLSKGADLTLTNKRGMSAMEMAMESGNHHLVDLLNPSNCQNQCNSHSSSFNEESDSISLQISYD